jgi:nitroreductase
MKTLLKNILLYLNIFDKFKSILEVIKTKFEIFKYTRIYPLFSWSGFLSSLYYTFMSTRFYREHMAVMQGTSKFHDDKKIKSSAEFLLRHNIHALEKGLCFRPLKKIFAVGYIFDTVKVYKSFISTVEASSVDKMDQLKWFTDILNQYFSVVGSHPEVEIARKLFESVELEIKDCKPSSIPYQRKSIDKSSVSYSEFLKLTKQRRSTRWFDQKEVSRDLIDKALLASRLSPTACNRQPIKYFIFDQENPLLLRKIARLPMGTAGFDKNIPAMAVIVGTIKAYRSERDKHAIYIDGSLSAMSFILALETLGLSSVICNWSDLEPREVAMQKALKLEYYERPIMTIAFGYPDMDSYVAFSGRRKLDDYREYNISSSQ